VNGGRVIERFSSLVDPERPIPARASAVHGIFDPHVAGKPALALLEPRIRRMTSDAVVVAHNARFDAMFLAAEFGRCGMQLPPAPVMCTMQLAGYYLGGLPARTLPACCQAAGVTLPLHHSALHDARAAAGLLACYRRCHRELPPSWQEALLASEPVPAAR